MRCTMPAITCDSEYGCTEWVIDYYEATASNWRELMEGWHYSPNDPAAYTYCPEHIGEAP